ncbi:MAG: hypothetical protein MUO19_01370, partial [Dehalococcoidales bacterium]|nr:hypothetical protein [Dehalococcoidales bacterium]
MSDYTGIAVYCEVNNGAVAAISAEGLGIGRKLADELGQKLVAFIPGSGIGEAAGEAISLGADTACVIDDPLLATYETDAYIHAVQQAVNRL